MADVPLLASQAADAPLGYQVPGAQEIIIKSITASYDGAGAAGSFVPTLQVLAPNGAVLASCPVGNTVAAGASVDVSWFPRGGLGTGGGGIRFDFDNEGGYLDVTANDTSPGPRFPGGINFYDDSGGGMNLVSLIVGLLVYAGSQSTVTYPGSTGGPSPKPLILASDGGNGAPSVVVGINGPDGDVFAVYDKDVGGDPVWFKVGNFTAFCRNIQNLDDQGLFLDDFSGTGMGMDEHGDGDLFLFSRGVGDIIARARSDGNVILRIDGAGNIKLIGLPPAAPAGSDNLWRDGDFVKIT